MAYKGILERAPSFSQNLAQQLTAGLGHGLNQGMEFAQKMALEKQKGSSLAHATKQMEKIKNLETGLGTIERMRELISSAGPSNAIQSFLGLGETREKRAELEALGRSLIPMVAAGVPIRNQREFDEYRKIITNPNARQADLEGALNGIENILARSIDEDKSSDEVEEGKRASERKPVFDVSNPAHKKTRDTLLKKYKNNQEKVRKELEKYYRE